MKKILTILLCIACFSCQDNSQEKAVLQREKELLEQDKALLQRERDIMHREKENATSTVEEYGTMPAREAEVKTSAYSEEVTKAKEVYNNIDNYVFVNTELLTWNCLFGGGTALITFKNTSHCKLELVIIDVEISKGNGTLLDTQTFSYTNIAPFTIYPKEIKFNWGCKAKATIRCITSDYLGIYTCHGHQGGGAAEDFSKEEVMK